MQREDVKIFGCARYSSRPRSGVEGNWTVTVVGCRDCPPSRADRADRLTCVTLPPRCGSDIGYSPPRRRRIWMWMWMWLRADNGQWAQWQCLSPRWRNCSRFRDFAPMHQNMLHKRADWDQARTFLGSHRHGGKMRPGTRYVRGEVRYGGARNRIVQVLVGPLSASAQCSVVRLVELVQLGVSKTTAHTPRATHRRHRRHRSPPPPTNSPLTARHRVRLAAAPPHAASNAPRMCYAPLVGHTTIALSLLALLTFPVCQLPAWLLPRVESCGRYASRAEVNLRCKMHPAQSALSIDQHQDVGR
jgi:hypothetical protein